MSLIGWATRLLLDEPVRPNVAAPPEPDDLAVAGQWRDKYLEIIDALRAGKTFVYAHDQEGLVRAARQFVANEASRSVNGGSSMSNEGNVKAGRRIAPWNQGAYNVYLARTNADEGAPDLWRAVLSEGVRTFSAVGPSRSAALRSLAAMVEFAEAAS